MSDEEDVRSGTTELRDLEFKLFHNLSDLQVVCSLPMCVSASTCTCTCTCTCMYNVSCVLDIQSVHNTRCAWQCTCMYMHCVHVQYA